MSSTVYFFGHQGWTDWFSQFSLYCKLSTYYPGMKHVVLVLNPQQIPFVERLMKGTSFSVEVCKTVESNNETKTCVECAMSCTTFCRRNPAIHCKIPCPDTYRFLVGLCAFDNYEKWDLHLLQNQRKLPFMSSFYTYYGFDPSLLYTEFTIDLNTLPIVVEEYSPCIVYHEQPGVQINKQKYFTQPIQYFNLDKSSENFFDSIPLLQSAKEMHFVQSSYSMFVYLLQLKFNMFSTIPITIHQYARGNHPAYELVNKVPHLPNWRFIL